MRCLILGFVGGAAVLQTRAALPGDALMAGFTCAAFLMLLLRKPFIAALAGGLLGFCWAAYIAHLALAPALSKEDEGRDVTIVGVVDSLPYNFDQGVRFQFKVEQTHGSRFPVPRS